MIAVLHGKEPDFTQVIALLDAGANPNTRDKDDVPAFHSIVEWGNLPAIRVALAKGADVKAQDDFGDTALHKVLTPDVALELLLAGASTTTRNEEYRTPRGQVGQTDNSTNYASIVSATRLLLQSAEVIEEDASKYRLSEKTLERIWPDNAFSYPGPSSPITHPATLRYFLHKAEETGADFEKSAVHSTTKVGEAMEYLLSCSADNIKAWNTFCDNKGTPMTTRDWQTSEVLEKIKPSVAAGLFDPDRIKKAPDLQGMYELFDALPESVQKAAPGTPLGKAISQSIASWLDEGAGATLKSSGIRTLRNEMPENIRPLFTNFHQEEQSRRHMGSTIGR